MAASASPVPPLFVRAGPGDVDRHPLGAQTAFERIGLANLVLHDQHSQAGVTCSG